MYKINDTVLELQPTLGFWEPREILLIDGNGHPVYPAVREFTLRWQLADDSAYNQLQTFFNTVLTTGTASVDLPEYAADVYVFRTYSGCVLQEPVFRGYFTEHNRSASLRITNINT